MNGPVENVRPWAARIAEAATYASLPPSLVAAVVAQESGGGYARADGSANPYAIRPERGFWARYGARVLAFVRGTPSPTDDRWAAFPDLASASYGLMQILWVTAIELGAQLAFPTELCDPEVGLRWGCAKLGREYARAGGDARAALLAYNGGGDPSYPDKVLAHKAAIDAAGLFPDR